MKHTLSILSTSERLGCLRKLSTGKSPEFNLVCFPWAGGGASPYRRFVPHLPGTIELFAIQYPGREDRFIDEKFHHMEQLVEEIVSDLQTIIDRPLIFFGHSMGALVAYEVAHALKIRNKIEPKMLIASGSGAPHLESKFVRCGSTDDDDVFIEDLRLLGGTPQEILDDPDIIRMLLPILRADYQVLESYAREIASPLSCPVISCTGQEDRSVTDETLDAWGQYSTVYYSHHWFEGGHFYLCSPVLAKSMVEWIFSVSKKMMSEYA